MTADPTLDISVAEAMTRAGVSAEAQRLMQANFNGNTLASMSQLSLSRAAAIFRAGTGPVYTIKGGSQRLTDAMGRRLKTPARLGQLVTSIVEDAGGVTITANGRAIHARHVICTIPFAALMGNVISNDGDALFPAIALNPRAAILATLYSTIPALIVAYGFYFLAPGFMN